MYQCRSPVCGPGRRGSTGVCVARGRLVPAWQHRQLPICPHHQHSQYSNCQEKGLVIPEPRQMLQTVSFGFVVQAGQMLPCHLLLVSEWGWGRGQGVGSEGTGRASASLIPPNLRTSLSSLLGSWAGSEPSLKLVLPLVWESTSLADTPKLPAARARRESEQSSLAPGVPAYALSHSLGRDSTQPALHNANFAGELVCQSFHKLRISLSRWVHHSHWQQSTYTGSGLVLPVGKSASSAIVG